MHTTISPFTFAHEKRREPGGRPQYGWRGASPEFGEIRVVWPALPHVSGAIVTEAGGDNIPTATFETRGLLSDLVSMPTLNRATCRVGGRLVGLDRRRWALTRRGRSLRLRHLGDDYRLTAVGKHAYRLTRLADDEDPGVAVTVRRSGIAGGRRLTVRATGRVLPADLALAVLFAGVDRSVLTRRGAVRAGFKRVFGFWAEATY
ncbi:hypothetical protein M4914_08710 [Streptomyces somaliensis DSM 40738]|uniref:Uncharacterized protein n=1 Tax=Streptomyces somaliensis (strain ATCC 33201 / DSM 40738 / JCM 12659 / KCTC 9044 / NCTC 11332 / NRRL B-12077 / IP 733) TaxID=1134445 RepID=A0AA44ICZ4_STRE0|nr:hypothetical protein [Streptomyces somaliensis]MCQ0023020.1 hypothetical protein [Streptomyces somaliensis DSM 40738]NKY13942.1 hypothetical protein [Streptomyces somaliensis DSM 40738]